MNNSKNRGIQVLTILLMLFLAGCTNLSMPKAIEDAAALDVDDITFGENDSASSITGSFTLPVTGEVNNSSITWSSSNPDVIAINGEKAEVTRPVSDTEVTLTAEITDSSGKKFTQTIVVTVRGEGSGTTTTSEGFIISYSSDGTASVTGYSGTQTVITIPGSVTVDGKSYTVTAIAADAFKDNSSLTAVTIPESVTSIGDNAFSGCTSIAEYTVNGATPAKLGENVFSGTFDYVITVYTNSIDKYKSDWSDYAGHIKDSGNGTYTSSEGFVIAYTADGKASITGYTGTKAELNLPAEVTINDKKYSITSIGAAAFKDKTDITSVTVPASVTSIGDNAFSGCTSITQYSFESETPAALGTTPFSGAADYSIYVPFEKIDSYKSDWSSYTDQIKGIGTQTTPDGFVISYTPDGKASVTGYSGTATEITLPSEVTVDGKKYEVNAIGASAFSDKTALTSVKIPASVTSIGDNAFAGCSSIVKYEVEGTTPANLGASVFSGTADYSITVASDNVDTYKEKWSDYADHIKANGGSYKSSEGLNVDYSGDGTATLVSYEGSDAKLNVPSEVTINGTVYTVTSIGAEAFKDKTEIRLASIPASITSIGDNAFSGCTSIHEFIVQGETPPNLGTGSLAGTEIFHILVPTGTGEAYRSSWSDYEDRIFPFNDPDDFIYEFNNADKTARVIYYENQAEMPGLVIPIKKTVDGISYTIIGVGDSRRSLSLGFHYSTLIIPESGSIESIGDNAFSDGLVRNISIADTVTEIGVTAISRVHLTTLKLPRSMTTITGANFSQGGGDSQLVIWPENLMTVTDNCFQSNTGLKEIPDTLVNIGYCAFENIGIEELVLSDRIETLGGGAFRRCRNLKKITFNNFKIPIPAGCFNRCPALETIIFSDDINSIGDYVCWGDYKLQTVTLPKHLTSIGGAVFGDDYDSSYDSQLTRVVVRSSVPPTYTSESGEPIFGKSYGFADYSSFKIIVPPGTGDAYKAADGWDYYADKIEEGTE